MCGSSLALGSEQETSRVCPRAWDGLSLLLVGLEPGGCSLGLGQRLTTAAPAQGGAEDSAWGRGEGPGESESSQLPRVLRASLKTAGLASSLAGHTRSS